jgi:glycosyltransferase involved in cell wall biosynthesis
VKPVKVLFLLPYPLHKAPSQRFRIEAYFPLLKENNIEVHTQVFLDEKGWNVLYKNGSLFQKAAAVAKGFAKRWLAAIFLVPKYDFVVVHREAAPLGPPLFEWIISRVWRRKMIFDFDDAIWIPAISEQNKMAALVKCFWKTKWICKWSYKISAGNEYLAGFTKHYNSKIVVVPTVVDTSVRYNNLVCQQVQSPSIGWTGSHSTIKYLDTVVPVLRKLEEKYDFDFYVICNQKPSFQLRSLKYIEWKQATEIDDLKKINIGIMPLEADQWSEGKCGFKIIQYLALGIPAVASPVGVNKIIIGKENGFLCSTEKEWYQALSVLLEDKALRQDMGKKGRVKIIGHYSLQASAGSFLSLFN